MSQKELEVVFVSTGPTRIQGPSKITGWGEQARKVCVAGPVADICVSRDGHVEFSLRILPDGGLVLTTYRGSYETRIQQNFRLRPSQSWEAAEAAGGEMADEERNALSACPFYAIAADQIEELEAEVERLRAMVDEV